MQYYRPSPSDLDQFERKGYVIVKGLFTGAETQLLSDIARRDKSMAERATSRSDAQGGTTTLSLSNDLEENYYAAIVRSQRLALSMQSFLKDEVYHYHHKMMLKEPRIGGAWEWHQDYGYWYSYGCLYPTMGSCYVAVDRANKENGCLQVIPGSHLLGRIDHLKIGGQTGADPERVEAALARLPLIYVEMEPGDGLFFHGNLLHRSDQNTSEYPRWALICCYNTKGNDPYKPSRHPNYSPLQIVEDSEVLSYGKRQWEAVALPSP